ncbi:hypothetical protein CN380_02880 [Bacillus sp. AFS017274]|nr:hypothetical protein CN380_02880 [Bacillus sp. AFS017274]
MQGALLLSKWVVKGAKSPKTTKEPIFIFRILVVGLLWGMLLSFTLWLSFFGWLRMFSNLLGIQMESSV